jgi:hypothetical protein
LTAPRLNYRVKIPLLPKCNYGQGQIVRQRATHRTADGLPRRPDRRRNRRLMVRPTLFGPVKLELPAGEYWLYPQALGLCVLHNWSVTRLSKLPTHSVREVGRL